MNTHEITVIEVPHNCGGHELLVGCSCGYKGREAEIGHGCADREEAHERLDTTHEALLPAWYAVQQLTTV